MNNLEILGIDLFAGAGGMSLGATWAGINVKIAVEIHHAAARTLSKNHPGCLIINGDLRHIVGLMNERRKSQRLVVFGGPPCQPFSTSNQRTRGPENAGNFLFRDFIRFVKLSQPEWVVFENVPGIIEGTSKYYALEIQKSLNKLGYDICAGVLNAVDFGVPQYRKRFFVIGALGCTAPSLPTAAADNTISVLDAIHDLPVLKNGASISRLKYRRPPVSEYSIKMRDQRKSCSNNIVSKNAEWVLRRYKFIPQGGNWSDVPAQYMDNYTNRSRCHSGIYHRLSEDQPSVVIGNYRKNMLIHPLQDRGLSVREAARLQSFPDGYEFEGSIGLQQQQVGNAVPPLLAKAVFAEIMKASK